MTTPPHRRPPPIHRPAPLRRRRRGHRRRGLRPHAGAGRPPRHRVRARSRRRRPHGERIHALRQLRQRRAVLHRARSALRARAAKPRPQLCKPWSANLVRVLDAHGRVAEAALPAREPHWVAQPGMDALVAHWAAPLGDALVTRHPGDAIERDALDAKRWQLRTAGADDSQHVYSGFDAVLLAVPPAPRARAARRRQAVGRHQPARSKRCASRPAGR